MDSSRNQFTFPAALQTIRKAAFGAFFPTKIGALTAFSSRFKKATYEHLRLPDLQLEIHLQHIILLNVPRDINSRHGDV